MVSNLDRSGLGENRHGDSMLGIRNDDRHQLPPRITSIHLKTDERNQSISGGGEKDQGDDIRDLVVNIGITDSKLTGNRS